MCLNLFIYKIETLLIAASQDRHFEFVIYSVLIFLHNKNSINVNISVSINENLVHLFVLDLILQNHERSFQGSAESSQFLIGHAGFYIPHNGSSSPIIGLSKTGSFQAMTSSVSHVH